MLQKEYKRLRQYIYNPGWSVEHVIHLLFIYLISSILVIFTYFIFFKLTCVRLGLLILPHEVCNHSCHRVILLPVPSVVKVSVPATSGKRDEVRGVFAICSLDLQFIQKSSAVKHGTTDEILFTKSCLN